ncbi:MULTISPECIES: zinc ABC transporter substrate-binding protein [Sulfitobacter]|jgi:zinc transport system substrate-binding protein|uniref:zinc ABC transporter substrate-binding protein n=1 Tax=Sulfitobacter TaxID=60136 RepID=UPI000C5E6B79|nr:MULTISPECIES: zinc ABC transporter substrate-binding protein [Sulfitobacter]MAX76054.1 zinc transporter [Roseobacter sp.]HAR80928.1 zinc transporter [Sulfitobacter pontiacus]|tara:strand:- start:6 stop:1049 length:1044 start_codon:yes stop_codon:yes gene_type:complete
MRRLLCTTLLFSAGLAHAEVPRVATDIAPVHSLVSMVMQGAGSPDLIIPPGASPHSYAMRPSEARAVAKADLVVWVGPSLAPWLEEPMSSLAQGAERLTLQQVEGIRLLTNRSGVAFEAHDHGDHEGHEDHDGHDDHAEHDDHEGHDHADHADHDDHDHDAHEEADAHAGHNHAPGALDPHIWLDPQNAVVWLDAIAASLSAQDPENAALYADNAAQAQAQLVDLQADIQAELTPLRGQKFVVFHDAYHYFEARFDVEASAAISLSDGAAPSAARLAEVRDVVKDTQAACVFTEPQFNAGLVDALQDGTALKSASLDPIGAALEPGVDMYPALLRDLAAAFSSCLAE